MLLSKDLNPQKSMTFKKAKRGLHALLRELSDDEVDTTETGTDASEDPDRPWSRYFRAYMDVLEQVPDGWSPIKWWGVSVPSPILNISTAYWCDCLD